MGGAVAALIALPYGLALAGLMGLPPVLGLFTSLLTAPITALAGRNPVLIGGTASATVPFIAAAVREQGLAGAAKISIVAGIFMMIFGVLRLGRHIRRVPATVVSGFSCGIGAMMVIGQLRTILGLPAPAQPAAEPLGQLAQALAGIEHTRWPPLLLGLAVIMAAFFVARRSPRSPAPLVGVIMALVMARVFGFTEAEVGRLSLELPPLAGFAWSGRDVVYLVPSAFALAIVASINILITSRVVDHFHGRRTNGADAELGAYGIANLCAGVFGAPVSVGIPARSLANVRCGGSTRVSNLAHAAFLLLFLSLGAETVSHIPIPALAGVTAYIGLCLLDWSAWRRLPRMRLVDRASFLVTALSVVALNAVAAIALGSGLYAAEWAYRKLSEFEGARSWAAGFTSRLS